MKGTTFLLLAGMTLTGAACASSDPAGVEEANLAGSWTWVHSSGGIAGMEVTPASAGVEREIRFLSGNRAELWEDDTRVRTVDWEAGVGTANGSFPGRDVVRWEPSLLGGWDEQGVAFPHPDTLVLADGCCDGYVWTFARNGG